MDRATLTRLLTFGDVTAEVHEGATQRIKDQERIAWRRIHNECRA